MFATCMTLSPMTVLCLYEVLCSLIALRDRWSIKKQPCTQRVLGSDLFSPAVPCLIHPELCGALNPVWATVAANLDQCWYGLMKVSTE